MELKAIGVSRRYFRQGKGKNFFYAVEKTDLTLASGALTEIVTSALCAQPCQYGVLALTGEGGSYHTECAVPQELADAAAEFFDRNSTRQGSAVTDDPALVEYLTTLNRAYFSGCMDTAVRDAELLVRWRQTDDFTARYLESLLEDILIHNAQDIASLCVLMTRMTEMYEHPETVAFSEDIYAMGRGLERMKYPEEARKCYRLATRGKMGAEASAALAVSYRRSGERKEAAEIWRRMIREGRGGIRPCVELAKYEEHTARNPREALALTEKALMLLSEPTLRPETVQELKNELQYRLNRLKRKVKERESWEC